MPNTELNFTTANKIVHVSVAVITRANPVTNSHEILIAKRPDHVHQGGLWEFPGGKVEQNETVLDALDRELFEELDIRIKSSNSTSDLLTPSRPLIQIHHAYPDKTVFLDVWLINSFSGVPIGKEGQAVRWIGLSGLRNYDFPEPNKSIITACLLPSRYFITPAYTSILDAEIGLRLALVNNAELIYLRLPQLTEKDYALWVEQLLSRIPELATKLMYQFDSTLNTYSGAGVHLSVARSNQLTERPISSEKWFAMSCHDEFEVEHAKAIGADFITLSPVLKTNTHPDQTGMGWAKFKALTAKSCVPVYGLGGLSKVDEPELIASGAQGLAGISFWQADIN